MDLFADTNGSVVKAYLVLKTNGKSIPPNWIKRYKDSRKKREKDIIKILRKRDLLGITHLNEWETFYKKECFYNGIRILFELEWGGKTKR
ncbi:MAG: hypothetical protein KGZ86_00785 [Candidatus Latescibacteria bacterium]|nr:hypothetical protein [Candidatus Latescibacterota bacterium]